MKTTRNSKRKPDATPPAADAKSRRPPVAEGATSTFSEALNTLTRHLALRDHSQFELRTKLGRKYPPELVERLMAEAEANGWLASEDEIAGRLALALARRHKSQMYIEGQLRSRGLPIPRFTTEDIEGAELENVRHLVERKFGAGQLTIEAKDQAIRFLKYRGFKDSVIEQVLNEKR